MYFPTPGRGASTKKCLLLILFLALLIPLGTPVLPAYAGGSLNVTTTADTPDANPGDGNCADASGACSLRAAIEEANALKGFNHVIVPDGTYQIGQPLVIDDSLILGGGGKGETIIDGDARTQLFHVRTAELLVCDASDSSVASYSLNGRSNPDFLSAGEDGISGLAAIAISEEQDDDLFVVAQSGVHRYAEDGAYEGLFINPALPLLADFAPSDGVFGGSGTFHHLFLADYYPNSRILRAEQTGGGIAALVKSGEGGLDLPNSIAIHDDDLYVVNTGSHQVLRYDGVTGTFVSVFVDGNLSTPRDLVFRGDTLYVTDQDNDRVAMFDALTGAYEGVFVAMGSGGLDEPSDMAFGPDGHLYVISLGTNDILSYDGATGAFRGVFAAGDTAELGSPRCLTWRSSGETGPGLTISNMTLRNGHTPDSGGLSAGITIDEGAGASMNRVAVQENTSSILGGGIRNWGKLTLSESEVVGNALPAGGGGMTSTGGGIFNGGELTVRRSLIAGNFATRGGGIANQGRVNLLNSTVSGNVTIGGGAGIRNVGKGVININASTITANRAKEPGYSGSDWYDFGGGIYNSEQAKVYLSNSILAGNTDHRDRDQQDQSPDCYSLTRGGFVSYGDNLFGVLTDNCVVHDTSHDLVGTPAAPLDPGLEPLADNGGPTATHKLHSTSPAIDVDTIKLGYSLFDCHSVDQRFTSRPQGRACDIGAFELIQGVGGKVPQPGDLVNAPPVRVDEAGIKATLVHAAPRRTPLSLAFATSDQGPGMVPLKRAGHRFVELDLAGTDPADVLRITFYYPSTVGQSEERDTGFQLMYFSNGAWLPVRGSQGAAPVHDGADNADGSVSGGRFTVTFDRTSSPSITELRQTIFTTAVQR